MKQRQEFVKINYTLAMIRKYGQDYVYKLKALKNKPLKADIIFYSKLLGLYKAGNEDDIVEFLENY